MTNQESIQLDPSLTTTDDQFVSPEEVTGFHNRNEDGGEGLTVAIMDSGIGEHPIWDYFGVEIQRPDIEGLPTDGQDTVGHGTGCGGCWLLQAPKIDTLVSVPIFGSSGRTGIQEIRRAYDYIVRNSDSIDYCNLSWGSPQDVEAINVLHNEMEQAGVQGVCAAGNKDGQTGSPATAKRAYSVAACTLDGEMTKFSSPSDDVSALGKNIALPSPPNAEMGRKIPEENYSRLMQDIGGEWRKASGTSFSTPIVGGLACSFETNTVSSRDAGRTEPFEKAFVKTAVNIEGTKEDGFGYVNYEKARNGNTQPETAQLEVFSINVPPFRGNDYYQVKQDVLEDGTYRITSVSKFKEILDGPRDS